MPELSDDAKRLLAFAARPGDDRQIDETHGHGEVDNVAPDQPPTRSGLTDEQLLAINAQARETLAKIADKLPMLAAPLVSLGKLDRKDLQQMLDLADRLKGNL